MCVSSVHSPFHSFFVCLLAGVVGLFLSSLFFAAWMKLGGWVGGWMVTHVLWSSSLSPLAPFLLLLYFSSPVLLTCTHVHGWVGGWVGGLLLFLLFLFLFLFLCLLLYAFYSHMMGGE